MRLALLLLVLLPYVLCENGMAELKAITGDAPYSGFGNAPAPIRQPMGFWGRPRYSPSGFGGNPFGGGGWGGYGGGNPDRFTSFGHSPYGEVGPPPFEYEPSFQQRPSFGLLGALTSLFGSSINNPIDNDRSYRPRSIDNDRSNSPHISRPSVVESQPDSFSLPSPGGLGGFYKGKGN